MSFPANPTVGTTYTTSNGTTYVFTNIGTWLSVPISNPTIASGEGIVVSNNTASLAYQNLTGQTSVDPTSLVSYYLSGHHYTVPFSTFSQNVLSQQAASVSVPLPTPASTISYTYPSDISIGNNTTANYPLGNLSGSFGTGSSNIFTFTQSGLYSISAFLQLIVYTNYDSNGGSAAVARAYAGFSFYRNGNSIGTITSYNTAYNYSALLTGVFPFVTYFAVGETISFTGYGTGDSFSSSGAYLHKGSFINITKLG